MGEIQEVQLQIRCQESAGVQGKVASDEAFPTKLRSSNRIRQYNWWFRVILYAFFLLSGQAVATLLGRLYYDKGGSSKWMATLVQSSGFPVLFAPLFIFKVYSPESSSTVITSKASPSVFALTLVYLSLGLMFAGDNMMYSNGLLYLPVSTYSLLCATQLAFNAIFSYFLNSQKLTPFIFNSLVLLTISASLLAAEPNSADTTKVSKGKYVIGFLCTLGASAGYSLLLSLTQLAFQKVIKKETITAVLEMQIFPSLVATCVCVVGIFASGDWKHLKKEMNEYAEGKVSYVMTLVWTAITWQISSVGTVGLILEATSLFTNVISTLGLPIIPIFAVIFFHDKLSGIKVVAMFLSLWGFVSYIYQHYIDNGKTKETTTDVDLKEEKL
ncbi:probable purine permease 11 isoform X2 [Papaver somniferum]|uniref:probable purine permease 11 isoform X2 n=1 Tax=Papaver somniferum TaxID=3469 RepID=UPI000E703452|nr:probable purine permease 11 isoform X2 [Papaver somniferum]